MRLDGEPWKQPLPQDDDTVMIEISHFGQVSILSNRRCLSKSISAPHSPTHDGFNSDTDTDEFEEEEESEERKKLGAAKTFRLPDDFDIASLS